MTANIRTSIEQKITPIIPSFSTSDMHTIASTIELNGNTVSRFRLFYRMIGIDDKTQDDINGKSPAEQRKIYGALVSKYITENSETMTKGTKKDPPKKRMDNIGRNKLLEVMKKYILKNPNDPRFNLSAQTQESKEPEEELEPELEDAQPLAQADAKDQFQTTVIPEVKVNNYPAMRNIVGNIVDKSFGLAESKRLLTEKKSETKAQARKTIANKLKQYKQKLKEESIAEAKAIAQSKREEKARKAQEKKSEMRLGVSDILRAQEARPHPQRVPEKAPEEKKQTVFNMGLSDLLASVPEPRVTPRVALPFAVIPPLVSTPEPAPAPQAEAVLEQPQEVKQRPRTGNLKLRGVINRAQQRDRKKQQELTMRNFRSTRQPVQEQKQELELDQVGLDADAEVQTQQQRENMLEQQLEQAQEVQLPPPRRTMGQYLLNQLGGASFSALSSILARRAMRTGDSDLGGYSAAVGGILGSAVYNGAMRAYPDILNNILADVNDYFRVTPQDIVNEARSTPAQGPQRTVDDIKGEGKHSLGPERATPPERAPILDSKSTPEQIDAFRASQGVPPANRGPMARLRGLGGAVGAYVDDAMFRQYDRVLRELDPQEYDEQGRGTKYNILGTPLRYDENGNRINALLDPNEEVLFDRPDIKGRNDLTRPSQRMAGVFGQPLDIPEGKYGLYNPDENDFVINPDYRDEALREAPPSRIREAIDRAKRVAKANEKNIITGGSALAGAGLIGAGIASSFSKQQPRIKEDPLIFKQEQTTQGDGEPTLERGAGKLKPKFIVPSANIFNKTEQEQYVDDIEFAMFDFVQDEGGNDPYGTNPLLRDQHITDGLRYQRAGVNVYSLYGANLPDNPKNMPLKKMNEMFLGENRLPEMKFLFSNEFEGQEFNQSEFEVDEYDVNNDRIAIEAYSPYANFTNNQLLDQFYDTSILYGVVP